MSSVEDLVQWYGAQLDEEERVARAADADLANLIGCVEIEHPATDADEAHALQHRPARVLREIDAKRGILARYEFVCREAAALDIDEEERETRVQVAAAFESCVVLLAAVYADRPGYLESWRA